MIGRAGAAGLLVGVVVGIGAVISAWPIPFPTSPPQRGPSAAQPSAPPSSPQPSEETTGTDTDETDQTDDTEEADDADSWESVIEGFGTAYAAGPQEDLTPWLTSLAPYTTDAVAEDLADIDGDTIPDLYLGYTVVDSTTYQVTVNADFSGDAQRQLQLTTDGSQWLISEIT